MEQVIKERSVDIPKDVRQWLKKQRRGVKSDRAFARLLGVHYNSIPRIMAMGTCHSDTLNKIQEKFQQQTAA